MSAPLYFLSICCRLLIPISKLAYPAESVIGAHSSLLQIVDDFAGVLYII